MVTPSGNCGRLDRLRADRICLIKPSSLGDVVQALPVLCALRDRFPRAHIAWVVNKSYEDLLAGHPCLDEVIGFDRRSLGLGCSGGRIAALWHVAVELRRRSFDLVCDLQGLLRSGLMAWATRARRRLGLSDAREGSRWFYTDVVPVPDGCCQAVERYWRVALALGAGQGPKRFGIMVGPDDRRWSARMLGRFRGRRIGMALGARWTTKRWPADSFAQTARRLVRDAGAVVVLLGSAEEAGAAAVVESAASGRCVNLVGRTSLKQLAAVLGDLDLLLTNDSGPMHLAAAMGTPVVGLFTCSSPDRAGPYGPGHLVVQTQLWCAGSYLKRCRRMECMAELSPQRLWPILRERIDQLKLLPLAAPQGRS